jgi:PAS domain-containing protein
MAQTGTDMLRHKRVLIAVRLVFVVLVGSMAIPPFVKGTLSPVLPTILAAYLFTNVALAFERNETFFRQRVQAALLLFDIFVLILAIAMLEEERNDLFLAMFLVVLLASAGQRLTVSIGGFIAVAAFYLWFSRDRQTGAIDWSNSTVMGLPVLLVVAIYVGYVSEAVARERRQREEAEDRLDREVQGMNRAHAILSNAVLDPDPLRLFAAITDAARSLLNATHTGAFWTEKAGGPVQSSLSGGFPSALAEEWASASSPVLGQAAARRVSAAGGSALIVPFSDRVGGLTGGLAILWPPDHTPLRAEEQAAAMLVQQASLCLENASLYRILTQTRDVWQAAFQSIPTPVVIVDGAGRILQANPAFLTLGEFDLANLSGSSFRDVLEGASHASGAPLAPEEAQAPSFATARLAIPRLSGEFDVTRGPYLGAGGGSTGSVWVLRKLTADLAAR